MEENQSELISKKVLTPFIQLAEKMIARKADMARRLMEER
jgi:hypothetical protein